MRRARSILAAAQQACGASMSDHAPAPPGATSARASIPLVHRTGHQSSDPTHRPAGGSCGRRPRDGGVARTAQNSSTDSGSLACAGQSHAGPIPGGRRIHRRWGPTPAPPPATGLGGDHVSRPCGRLEGRGKAHGRVQVSRAAVPESMQLDGGGKGSSCGCTQMPMRRPTATTLLPWGYRACHHERPQNGC